MALTAGTLSDPDVVHVWRVAVADESAASLAALLSDEERARAARFMFARDRNQFIVVRGWLRRLLGEYLNRSPDEIRLILGARGKPMVADDQRTLHFNVSHSGDVGLLAFCSGREVGIDVERTDTRVEIEALAETCFSTSERASLRRLPGGAQLHGFFQLWAAKEAYIKALGGGLSIPLLDFTVNVLPDADSWTVTADEAGAWPTMSVRRIVVPPGYAAAVAAKGRDWRLEVSDLADDERHR